ncbi:MAG: four helix bundle protein [Crocinitomicaceae bacterium]
MSLTPLQELIQSKTLVRKSTRDLIEVVFKVSDLFPENDKENYRVVMRKKALSISSFVSHGTAQTEKKDQADHFLAVMHELRELLKLANETFESRFITDKYLAYLRLSISNVINALDKVTKLLGCFEV